MAKQGRRTEVLEAAIRLFSARGYHGTSVREIADALGMGSGSIYAHIESKEDLLFEVVDQAAERFVTAVRPIAGGPGPAAGKLRQALIAHAEVVAASRDAATVFLHEWKALSPERRAAVAAKRDAYEELYAGIIRQGVAEGRFRAVDEKFARLLVLSAGNWLYEWYDPAGPMGPAEVAERFADLILQGLQRKETGRGRPSV